MGQTLAEKIFSSHVVEMPFENTWVLKLDTVFCHEITTPIAITDLQERGMDRVFDPRKIKAVIDHVSPAKDSKTAEQGKALRLWARRHGIEDFFDIGRNGVCHAIFPEKGFVRPGYALVMGDSHTCTHGAFGAFAAGVGTTDLEIAVLKGVCAFGKPETFRVDLEGKLPAGVFPKDVILAVIAKIGVAGATNKVIEFRGPVVDAMSMEGRMTLCNMAVEAGGTSGLCMPDATTVEWLWPFIGPEGEGQFASKEEALAEYSRWGSDEDAIYAARVSLDCSSLEPLVTKGYSPDNVVPLRTMKGTTIDQVYIGSCTNGRIEDLREAAAVLKGRTIHPQVRGIVSPATQAVYTAAVEEGIIETFLKAGFCVVSPGCGACLGMSNGVLASGEVCASTTNRNFSGRMGRGGMIHLMSPASAAAAALAGALATAADVAAQPSIVASAGQGRTK
jgi:homoaconitate hydratase family protein/3-isopropylmalate dehydratase, large subunit